MLAHKSIIVFSTFALSISSAYSAMNTITVDPKIFKEAYTETVNVSGIVRVGVMYSSTLSKADSNSLYVDIKSGAEKILCVNINSIDGQYSASFELTIPTGINGVNRFILPSKFEQQIVITLRNI